VPKSRNPVDITIEQTINRHAKRQGGIIVFSRNYSAYYRWSTTRHRRAQYVEAALQVADMVSEDCSVHKELEQGKSKVVKPQFKLSKKFCRLCFLRAFPFISLCSFTNPFEKDTGFDELYCLSSGVPAKPEAATNLLDAVDIGRAAMTSLLIVAPYYISV